MHLILIAGERAPHEKKIKMIARRIPVHVCYVPSIKAQNAKPEPNDLPKFVMLTPEPSAKSWHHASSLFFLSAWASTAALYFDAGFVGTAVFFFGSGACFCFRTATAGGGVWALVGAVTWVSIEVLSLALVGVAGAEEALLLLARTAGANRFAAGAGAAAAAAVGVGETSDAVVAAEGAEVAAMSCMRSILRNAAASLDMPLTSNFLALHSLTNPNLPTSV